jgi:hypothetical protein
MNKSDRSINDVNLTYYLILLLILCGILIYQHIKEIRNKRKKEKLSLNIKILRLDSKFETLNDFFLDIKNKTGSFPIDKECRFTKDIFSKEKLLKYETIYWWHNNYFSSNGKEDIFQETFINKGNKQFPSNFKYISDGDKFILVCCGPDKVYENDKIYDLKKIIKTLTKIDLIKFNNLYGYDPTNGIVSRGDIFITSKNLGFPKTKTSILNKIRK